MPEYRRMRNLHFLPGILAAIGLATVGQGGVKAAELRERWIYFATNLAVDRNIDDLKATFDQAAKAGCNGVLLDDSKFGKLGDMPAHYFENVNRVKQIAAADHLQIVPSVFPIGYSESLLWHNPNLAEGMPVKEALFIVKGGVAQLQPDPPVELRGADFRNLSLWSFHDPNMIAGDGAITVKSPGGQNARIAQRVKLHPFRQYHIAVEVKTNHFSGTPQVTILGHGDEPLNYANLGTKGTQDWTTEHVVFNSLDNNEVGIYFGCWDGKEGTLSWRNPRMEETALVNLLRRDGAPLTVKTEEGRTLAEGRDFAKVVDPRMGTVPWSGAYEVWHAPPAIHTPLPDGTRLRVSFYHAVLVNDGQVTICPRSRRRWNCCATRPGECTLRGAPRAT